MGVGDSLPVSWGSEASWRRPRLRSRSQPGCWGDCRRPRGPAEEPRASFPPRTRHWAPAPPRARGSVPSGWPFANRTVGVSFETTPGQEWCWSGSWSGRWGEKTPPTKGCCGSAPLKNSAKQRNTVLTLWATSAAGASCSPSYRHNLVIYPVTGLSMARLRHHLFFRYYQIQLVLQHVVCKYCTPKNSWTVTYDLIIYTEYSEQVSTRISRDVGHVNSWQTATPK